jgi:hypothetical protein
MYDSEKYLIDFKEKNAYPSIHNEIYNRICMLNHNRPMLDLGCCFGLLAERLNNSGINCIGVEKSIKHINLGRQYGIKSKIYNESIDSIDAIIKEYNIELLIARRCLPEAFGNNIENGYLFSKMASQLNVTYIVIEGRVVTKNHVNQLFCLDEEIKLFLFEYECIDNNKNIAILKKKT